MSDVRSVRTSLGLSQIELAMKLGIHQSTVSRLETGDMPLDARTRLALFALQSQATGNAERTGEAA